MKAELKIMLLFHRASGKEFGELIKQNYPESYEILSDKNKAENYMIKLMEILKGNNIKIKGVCVHYPKLIVVN